MRAYASKIVLPLPDIGLSGLLPDIISSLLNPDFAIGPYYNPQLLQIQPFA